MQLLDGHRQSRSASRLSQVTPREERPLLSRAGSDSESSEEEEWSWTSEAHEEESWCWACRKWLEKWLDDNALLVNKFKLLASYGVGQLDQCMDGWVIVTLMESGFMGWAGAMMAIVLLPQLLIWAFLHHHKMTGVPSLARILFFPTLVLAAVCILCLLPPEAIEEDTRWWLVNKAVFFESFSVDPLYHLFTDWKKGQHDKCGWWSAIGEGVLEASCSSVFTIYIMFLQKNRMEPVFICSCIGSILSITKTATELHFYGEKPGLATKLRFAFVHTFPHVLWRLLSLAMLAYLLRPADISLKENRAELFEVFLLHDLLTNSLILRLSSRDITRSVVLLFSFTMVVLGPPFFLSALGHTRGDHWVVQLISFLFAVVVALHLVGHSPTHAYELWQGYSTFVIVWLVVTPWSAASSFCLWSAASAASQEEDFAKKKAQSASHKLRAAAQAGDGILINLMLEVEGAKESDALSWVKQDEIKIDTCGASKWEGIAELDGSLYCAPRMAGEVLVVNSANGTTKYWKLEKEGSYFGIVAYGKKLYCGPADAQNVLVIDSRTEILTTIDLPPRVTQGHPSRRWAGIAQLKGKLYCAPSFADTVLVVDIENKNYVESRQLPDALQTKSAKFFGIVAYKDKLYCCPRDADKVLVIEPEGEMSTIDLPAEIANDKNKWSGIAACGEKLYCSPLSAGGILVIDPHTRETNVVPLGSKGTGFYKWSGIVAHKGRLFCSPHNSTELLVIDPGTEGKDDKGEVKTGTPVISSSYVSGRCSGIVVSKDKLWCCPCGLDVVLSIDPADSFLLQDLKGGPNLSDAQSKGHS